jgi:hypothetical protein
MSDSETLVRISRLYYELGETQVTTEQFRRNRRGSGSPACGSSPSRLAQEETRK